MMQKTVLASALTLAMIAPAQALPLFDLDAGVGSWLGNYQGYIIDETFDVDSTMGMNDNAVTPTHAYAEFRHPLPLIPNLRAAYTSAASDTTFNKAMEFGGYSFDGDMSLDLDLTHVDANLFYEINMIPFIDVSAGVGLRSFQGGMTLNGKVTNPADGSVETETVALDFSAVPMPQGSLAARIDPPFMGGLYLSARADGLAWGNTRFVDWSAGAGLDVSIPLLAGARIEGGWREWSMKLDPNDLNVEGLDQSIDTTLSGLYLNAGIFF